MNFEKILSDLNLARCNYNRLVHEKSRIENLLLVNFCGGEFFQGEYQIFDSVEEFYSKGLQDNIIKVLRFLSDKKLIGIEKEGE